MCRSRKFSTRILLPPISRLHCPRSLSKISILKIIGPFFGGGFCALKLTVPGLGGGENVIIHRDVNLLP